MWFVRKFANAAILAMLAAGATFAPQADAAQLSFLADISGGRNADVEWGDSDGDGDLDVVAEYAMQSTSRMYVKHHTNNAGSFTGITTILDPATAYSGYISGGVTWGDFDNDGDVDLIASASGCIDSSTSTYSFYIQYHRNNGSGSFSQQASSGLPETTDCGKF